MSKNVLILSGSPRKGGNSDLLCDEFLRGAAEAGNKVEKIRVAEKKIGYCSGCYYCQKSGGVCARKDDMAELLQKMIDALKALPSKPRILLCTPIPAIKDSWTINEKAIAEEVIPMIEKAAKKNKLEVIDLHTAFTGQEALYQEDGIHPTQQGVRKIAEIVAKAIDPNAKTEQRGFFGMGGARPR